MWDNILGNEQHKKFLEHYLQSDARPHALLFVGPAGLGKRRLALAFAKSLLCFKSPLLRGEGQGASFQTSGLNGGRQPDVEELGQDDCQSCRQFSNGVHPDFVEVTLEEGKKSLTIEQVRDLIAGSAFAPTLSSNKVILLNDVDLLRVEAANALLKILEEPPESWTLVLTATHEERILPTILSRVVTLRFRPLTDDQVLQIFSGQVKDETQGAVYAKLAEGSIGTALEMAERNALELRQNALGLLQSLPTKVPLNLATAVIGGLDSVKQLEREPVLLWLRLLQQLLRDVLFLKLGIAGVYNEDLVFELKKVAACGSLQSWQRALAGVERAYGALNGNVGLKQILEQLVLDINKVLID